MCPAKTKLCGSNVFKLAQYTEARLEGRSCLGFRFLVVCTYTTARADSTEPVVRYWLLDVTSFTAFKVVFLLMQKWDLQNFARKHKRQGQHHRAGGKPLFGFEIFNSITFGANTCEPVNRWPLDREQLFSAPKLIRQKTRQDKKLEENRKCM